MSASVLAASVVGAITAAVEAVGLTALRSSHPYGLVIAMLTYGLGVTPLLKFGLRYEGIGMVNFLWNVFSTITMFVIGIYIFGESVHYLQVIGVTLSLLGIGLILIAPESSAPRK